MWEDYLWQTRVTGHSCFESGLFHSGAYVTSSIPSYLNLKRIHLSWTLGIQQHLNRPGLFLLRVFSLMEKADINKSYAGYRWGIELALA